MRNSVYFYKIILLCVLAIILGGFTHCMLEAPAPKRVPAQENYTVPDPAPKSEEEVLNATQVEVGIKNHEQLLHTMAILTGVSAMNANIQTAYKEVTTTLPTDNDVKTFLAPNQIAVSRLAAEFCNELVGSTTLRAQIWPGFNFDLKASTAFASTENMLRQTAAAFWSVEANSDEAYEAVTILDPLIDDLLKNETDNATTTKNVMKGVCTAALSSAQVTLL